MGKKVGVREAAEIIGLSQWELRTGAKAGKYPSIRVGDAEKGKIVFDIELLEKHIEKMMQESIEFTSEVPQRGKLRKLY